MQSIRHVPAGNAVRVRVNRNEQQPLTHPHPAFLFYKAKFEALASIFGEAWPGRGFDVRTVAPEQLRSPLRHAWFRPCPCRFFFTSL
jgi:hypothetical protein